MADEGNPQGGAPQGTGASAAGHLTIYVLLWIGITIWLAYEYLVLNKKIHGPSFLGSLHRKGILAPKMKVLTPTPGEALSFRMGWVGFTTICLTNLYILRKKVPQMRTWGSIPNWLDFHIFCGMLGPTIIVFHSNFKVGGLVAISFWSMMISFASGLVGRYFYMQLLTQKVELSETVSAFEEGFDKLRAAVGGILSDTDLRSMKERVLRLSGVTPAVAQGRADLMTVVFASFVGDFRLLVSPPPVPRGVPAELGRHLKQYALARRRFLTTSYFRRLMGYWHAFHMPFAVFMYVVSVLHIMAALIFRVNH